MLVKLGYLAAAALLDMVWNRTVRKPETRDLTFK
jgi:hypothetical protein